MRIAYIAPYQGPTLVSRRPIVRNRSMSNRIKIELIATLLRESSHDVEIISQGEVVESACRFYPSFSEPERFHADIPVYYGSVLPIRRLNGLWSNLRTLHILKERHNTKPYDVMIIFNLKGPQLHCANYAIRHLGLPLILEYEDDRFVDVEGAAIKGLMLKREARVSAQLFRSVSGCMAVSPHLLSQLPAEIPSLLLRGVVGADLIEATNRVGNTRRNVVLFSGTHIASNGVAHLIAAWRNLERPDWTLHITGHGGLTESLRSMAQGVPGIVFDGMVNREELVRLMGSAKICMNPHQVSQTPGNVFAFKIIEYLAAGAHVITTPMGALEKDMEAGITYMSDNSPDTITATLRRVIDGSAYRRTAMESAQRVYGPPAVSKSLDTLLHQVTARK
jgi:glycosyltransferase involved in cell wall biosynthesis